MTVAYEWGSVDTLIRALELGDVEILYSSMTSNKIHKDIYTLRNSFGFSQNLKSNKLIVLHTKTGMYEDIEKNTIIAWNKK
jgi:hypothetical protein